MTISVVQQMSPSAVAQIKAHLDDYFTPHLGQDVSRYARGRRRLWFPNEAPLSASQHWRTGHRDARVWDWITRTLAAHNFVPEVALASLGGNISEHRDAPYADFVGFGINLGRATFYYRDVYRGLAWRRDQDEDAPLQRWDLTGGEIIRFNVKNPHFVEDAAPDRWAINCWRISRKERVRYETFLASLGAGR